jgi:hypothetical protein
MDFTALPTWQYASVGITGMLVLGTSLYLIHEGYFLPATVLIVIAVALVVAYLRVTDSEPSEPPPMQETQFTVFRSMEPADQTRVNPWTGFLQEDVYANPFGPIGTFVGNDDVTPKAPLYPYKSTTTSVAAYIPSCQKLERDLSGMSQMQVNALVQQCQADMTKFPVVMPSEPEVRYSRDISARNCPRNVQCSCIALAGDPRKTHCGYGENGVFIPCPSDCCTPACTY